ncbi:MAG: DUF2188 domain-containing protein [Leptolyngbya sp.]|nr:DUF2188 domain-containing protein [Candidatus Melainabacteria bacterium]
MNNNELHVVPTVEGWEISPEQTTGEEIFDTQTDAVVAAEQVAKMEKMDVVIHADDGTIQETCHFEDLEPKEQDIA